MGEGERYASINVIGGALPEQLKLELGVVFVTPHLNIEANYHCVKLGRGGLHGLVNVVEVALDMLPTGSLRQAAFIAVFDRWHPKIMSTIMTYDFVRLHQYHQGTVSPRFRLPTRELVIPPRLLYLQRAPTNLAIRTTIRAAPPLLPHVRIISLLASCAWAHSQLSRRRR
jgi:hypothetical protein